MTITRKIEIRVTGENKEEISRKWEILRGVSYATVKVYNKCMSIYYTNDLLLTQLRSQHPSNMERAELEIQISNLKQEVKKINVKLKKTPDEEMEKLASAKLVEIEKLIEQRRSERFTTIAKSLSEEAIKISKLRFGALDTDGEAIGSVAYDAIKEVFPPGFASVASAISMQSGQLWNQYRNDVFFGKKSLPTFKPGCPFPTNKRTIQNFRKEDKEFHFDFGGISFATVNSYKDGSNSKYLNDVLDNWEILCDSKIQVKGAKIYFLMVVNQEVKKIVLDKTLCVGVDLGIAVPAVVALSKGYGSRKLGTYEDLTKFKRQIRGRYADKKRNLMVKGGNGRRGVDSFDSRYHEKERNYTHTYNHTLSKNVIDFAVKNGAGVIKMENLSFHSVIDENGNKIPREEKDHKMLSVWPYAELQTMIEYKAKMYGIDIVYVNPYHTSVQCSVCGSDEFSVRGGHKKRPLRLEHISQDDRVKFKGVRFGSKHFVCTNPDCPSCGKVRHADINAAVNIARG